MRTVDLFCGAGGFTLGAEAAGAEVVLGVDKWEPAVATARRAGHRVACADVGDLDAWLPLVEGPIDLVIGGPPCQPFSVAGAGQGEDDERDGYPAALAAIRALRPTWAVLENVRGLLTDRHRAYREEIIAELRETFAWVGLWLLDAADFGVPQHRRRVFLVAGPHPVAAPQPTHAHPSKVLGLFSELKPWVTMGEALGIQPGQRVIGGGRNASDGTRSYRDLTDEPSTTVTAVQVGNAGPWVVDIAGSDPSWLERPAPTVSATEARGHTMARNGWKTVRGRDVPRSVQRASDALYLATGRRRLTVSEAARLLDFPDDYPWPEKSGDAYRAVGNAVPRGLGAAVVGAIIGGRHGLA